MTRESPTAERVRRGIASGVVAVLALTAACGTGGTGASESRATSSDPPAAGDRGPEPDAEIRTCERAPVPDPDEPGFARTSSRLAAVGTPRHSTADAVATPDSDIAVAARFQYGRLRLDLDGERVEFWVDDCSASARLVGVAETDDDGVVVATLPSPGLEPGRYALYAVVAGDGTFAPGTLTVAARGTEVAVFDVDGTLTVGDSELIGDVLSDLVERLTGEDYVPEARSGAAEATRRHASLGRLVVYLTGRPVWLADLTREWLSGLGAAPGPLLMPAHDSGARPTSAGVGATKTAVLDRLAGLGFTLADAYGNAATDVEAYRAAGVPASHLHVLGLDAPPGVDALGEDFDAHLDSIAPG